MADGTSPGRRVRKMALVVVGGAVVLTTTVAQVASADEISFQGSTVVNAGAAGANSGGNVAIGNASRNVAATGQGAAGGLASNNSTTNNTSTGTATINTGAATASGSIASNTVDQDVSGPDDDTGLQVGIQDSNVVNAGAAFSNTGGNVGIGNASTNIAATGQGAVGGIASNTAETTNTSGGDADITTGAATARGTVAENGVTQDIASGVEDGLAILVQDADVINFGLAGANSGGNAVIGNAALNVGVTGQGAAGLVATNNATTGNTSTGTAEITTGVANAVGSLSENLIYQGISGPDGGFLAVMFQDADAFNLGAGVANSGGNAALGNVALNVGVTLQGLAGLIANNVADTINDSDGVGLLTTGAATGSGTEALNDIKQNS